MGARVCRSRAAIAEPGLRRCAIATLVLAACLLGTARSASGASANRTATRTYLQAVYDLDLTFEHNRSAADSAERRSGAAIAAECPKVLAGAPGNLQSSSSSTRGGLTPRAQGEANRHEHQFTLLSDELETVLRVAAFKVEAAAFTRFTETVGDLHWSDPAIAATIQSEISLLKVIYEPQVPADVCADMRFWVASGYRTLSPATLAFIAGQEGLAGSLTAIGEESPERALRRYEGPRERALAKRVEGLRGVELFESGGRREAPFRKALGIESASPAVIEPKRTIIGRGVAHTGEKFEIEASPGYGPSCPHIISASYTFTSAEGSLTTSGSSGSLHCLSGGVPNAHPEADCQDGVIVVFSTTLPATREVRLTLSDGRTILSKPIAVPRRDGGPAGAYLQAVKGPSPYPVSISELGAGGTILRSTPLRAVKDCHPPQRTSRPVVRTLVRSRTPGGRTFTILASANGRKGHRTLAFFATGLGEAGLEESLPANLRAGAASRYFPWTLSVACQSPTESLIYGQLKAPGTTVLVATATTPLTALTLVSLPAALKAAGTLAYAVLTGLPSELVVRDATGKTLVREDLSARSKWEAEYCEGYAEAAAQPSSGG